MATETLILRPTDGSAGGLACHPDTLDPWDLINEEVADDDATYVAMASGSMFSIASIKFTLPDEYKTVVPSSVKVHHRTKSYGASDTAVIWKCHITNPEDGSVSVSEVGRNTVSSTYQDYVVEISQDILEIFYLTLLNPENNHVSYQCTTANSGKDSNSGINITQVYLELTYEAEDSPSESIFIRQNGSWVELSGAIYEKQNGVWTLVDSSTLQNKTHYILNDITT